MGNSVIYRPAYDAEVEYLESTGTQFIDTGFIPDDTCGLYVRAYPHNASLQKKVVGCGSSVQSSASRWWINFASTGKLEISWNAYNETIQYNKNQWYEVTNNFLNSRTGTVDGVTQNVSYPTLGNNNYTAYIFNVNSNVPDAYVGKISSVKFSRGSEIVMDFIPVRIGSIGYMYDKVSKQLFANKGTGQFILGNDVVNAVIPQQRCVLYFGNQRSVGFERIYEEYEWLKGDGEAYIQTSNPFIEGDIITCELKLNSKPASLRWKFIYGNNAGDNDTTIMLYEDYKPNLVFRRGNIVYTNTSLNTVYSINHSLSLITVNGTTVSSSTQSYTANSTPLTIFTSNYVAPNSDLIFDGAFSSFKLSDKLNLIPCKLLQSIPAILDGNGIARQAGECGMWDKVSNKFYGNVANSGTFTVKGPKCYEEYNWLVGDGSAYIDTKVSDLSTIESIYCYFIGNGIETQRVFGRDMKGSSRFVTQQAYNKIRVYTDGDLSTDLVSPNNEEGYILIDYKNATAETKYSQGTIVKNTITTGPNLILFGNNWGTSISNFFTGKIHKFEIKNILSFIPCKLTHGIPASVDANGIARPAGTCGMWDKVNDKFYGNVASSGSFTVSND